MMNPKAAVVLGQPPTEEQLDELIASEQEAISQMASAQDKGLEASLPEVELSDSVKKNVLSVLNELAPLFKLDKLDSWDEQVWRRILASVQAVNDAVADDALAEKINFIGLKYNKAKVLVESNNHGGTVLQELENLHYPNLWLDKQAPWLTTTKTRILLFNHLRKLLVQKQIPDMDISTYSQLKSLKIEGDSVVLPKNKDGHSDRVVAMALAYMCTDSVVVRTPAQRPVFPSNTKNPFNRH